MLNTLHHDLGLNTEATPAEAPWKLSITGVIMRLVKRTAHLYALDQGRDASCQECLLQAVMPHSRLLKHGGYTPVQLLFGHEPAPIEGETLDDEQQCRSITESMAERLARQQSAMKAWLQAEAESRVERAQNRRTRTSLHWPSGTRVCYCRADVPSVGSLPTIRQGSTAHLNNRKGAWLGSLQFWLRKKGEARSNTKNLMAQFGSWCVVDSCGVHLNICDIFLNERVCHSIETKKSKSDLEHSQTLYRIASSLREHTLIFEVSVILLMGQSRDISVVFFFLRTPMETSGTSSSEAKAETIPVDESPIDSSDTKLEDPMPVKSDTPETKPVTETYEMHMETDDHVVETPVPEPPLAVPTVFSFTFASTQNLWKTWICSETRKECQASNRVARRRLVLMSGQLQSFESKSKNMSAIMVLKELVLFLRL